MRTAVASAVLAVVLTHGAPALALGQPAAPMAGISQSSAAMSLRPQGLGSILCGWLTYMCWF